MKLLNQIFLLLALIAPEAYGATLVVTNAVDFSPGSLRLVVAGAAPGDTVIFATNLSGATLSVFSGGLSLNQTVTIDASALPGGIVISAGGPSRVLAVTGSSATVVLTALTIANGKDSAGGAGGGGINNAGTLTLNRCTLTANVANVSLNGGGAIMNSGTLTLNQCTLSGNVSTNDSGGGGGAICSTGSLVVNQSTIYGNDADNGGLGGGGIYSEGPLTVYNSIVASNSAVGGSGMDIYDVSAPINFIGTNIVQNLHSTSHTGNLPLTADPQLRPLGNYGGPTPTMPPLPASAARSACVNSQNFATDQRGVPRLNGQVTDIGPVKLAPPTVTTLPATTAVNTNATLNAAFNPNTLAATAWFQWGLTNNPYSSQTASFTVAGGNTNTALAFSNLLTTLTPGVVYHCRAVVTNVDGTTNGNDVLFGSAPIVMLVGPARMTNECHTLFNDPGATNSLGLPVTVAGSVNTNAPGTYPLTYTVTNSLGTNTATRTVVVVDTTAPVITLLGANPYYVAVNTPLTDPGATAWDACGGSFAVATNGTVNTAVPGSYTVTYSATDSYNNTATAMRTVVVRPRQIVTTLNDSVAGSLRQIISNSISGDFIQFATNLSGSAIVLTGGELVLSNNLTIDASAVPGGIQLYGNGTSRIFRVPDTNTIVVLTALTIASGNAGDGDGGGINNSAMLTLNHCVFLANHTQNGGGGGIFNFGFLTVNNCSFISNYSVNGLRGGAVYDSGCSTFNNCEFTNNQALAGGGGVVFSLVLLTMNQCSLVNNQADVGGAIFVGFDATMTLNQCSLSGNRSTGFDGGGGIYNQNQLTVNQCTFTGNSAEGDDSSGGAIGNFYELYMSQCTVIGNHADKAGPDGGGGGIYDYYSDDYVGITNSIIAGNSMNSTNGAVGPDICSFSDAGAVLFGANIVQSGLGVVGSPITNDPVLAPLGDYGGPTQTMPPLPGSPAIDACPIDSGFATDQRGFPRLVGAFPDIGAVEGVYNPNGPGRLTGMTRLGNGSSRFRFTNFTDTSFTVLATTNLTLPLNTWSNLGSVGESPIGSGQFQFTDPQATNYPQRFYRVRMP